MGYVPHTGYLAHRNRKGKIRGRRRHKSNNSKRVVRNLKERNVQTRKSRPKQGLTSAEELTIDELKMYINPKHR